MNASDNHIVSIILSDEDVRVLADVCEDIDCPAKNVIKRIVYQANDSPIFCSVYNRPIKHLDPHNEFCQPFPLMCMSCSMAIYEE